MGKIEYSLSMPTLKLLISDIKTCDKTIGFTHGAFDLFHSGHLYLLKEAAKKCDFLIVGVESDVNVATYKNTSRPVITQNERHEIINNIYCVGNAFIIDMENENANYEKLYRLLQIDVLTVGQNFFALNQVTEQSKRLNFKLHVVDIVNPIRTTNIINKIKASI